MERVDVESLRELDRRAWRMHSRHAASWSFRVLLFTGLIVTAVNGVAHPIGAVISVVSAYLLYRSLLFCVKGHRKIAKYRKAKRYWLQAEADPADVKSVEILTAELIEESGDESRFRKAG